MILLYDMNVCVCVVGVLAVQLRTARAHTWCSGAFPVVCVVRAAVVRRELLAQLEIGPKSDLGPRTSDLGPRT